MTELQARDLPQELEAEDVEGELYIPADKLERLLAWAELSNTVLLGMDGLLVGGGMTQPVLEASADRDRLPSGWTLRAACLDAREWLERAAQESELRPVFSIVFE